MRAHCRDLGLMEYRSCWELQQKLFDALVEKKRTRAKQEYAAPREIRFQK